MVTLWSKSVEPVLFAMQGGSIILGGSFLGQHDLLRCIRLVLLDLSVKVEYGAGRWPTTDYMDRCYVFLLSNSNKGNW